LSISEPGFQLSFIATIAILGWSSMRANDLRERSRLLIPPKPPGAFSRLGSALFSHIKNSLWVAVISTAVTAPLIATHFHRVHPAAPLLSVCLYPLIAASLLLGLSSILLGFIWIEAGFLAADAATVFARMLNGLLVFSRNIPGHCFNLPPPGFTMISIFYLLLGAGISKKTRGAALLLSTLILPIALIVSLAAGNENNPRLIHLDAGAGSAALLELPGSKRAFLIDACGKTRTGSWRLARSLLDKGHRRIDGIILTHPHVDHAGALPVLTRSLDVGEVFCSEHFDREEYGEKLLADARKKGVLVSKVRRGQLLRLPGPEDIVLRIIYPDQTENLPLVQHANEMSLSFFIEIGQKRILCLGDLEEDGLARLFETGEDLNSEILILPHHGRSNRLYDTLLEKVSPTTVVVSGDGQGQAEETLLRIELSGIKTYATWRGGSIQNEWNTAGIKTSYVDR
jgi:beta-lactamase superfamily II metal-dependent hydrolase